jgi:hypothetical protein
MPSTSSPQVPLETFTLKCVVRGLGHRNSVEHAVRMLRNAYAPCQIVARAPFDPTTDPASLELPPAAAAPSRY